MFFYILYIVLSVYTNSNVFLHIVYCINRSNSNVFLHIVYSFNRLYKFKRFSTYCILYYPFIQIQTFFYTSYIALTVYTNSNVFLHIVYSINRLYKFKRFSTYCILYYPFIQFKRFSTYCIQYYPFIQIQTFFYILYIALTVYTNSNVFLHIVYCIIRLYKFKRFSTYCILH